MKRWGVYLVILAMLGISPGIDISKLSPVETVWLSEENGQILIRTDSGEFGAGNDFAAALADLKASAAGIVFMETADYLIIKEGSAVLLTQVGTAFRPSCRLCTAAEMPELETATAFLRMHEPLVTLRQWNKEQTPLPQLQEQDGRFEWIAG